MHEPLMLYYVLPTIRVCVKVDLLKDPHKSIDLEIGDHYFRKWVVYINMLNTFYLCQSIGHKIKDYPLIEVILKLV